MARMARTAFLIGGLLAALAAPPPAAANDVTMGVGLSLPPYVIVETDSGIELDLVRGALALAGFSFRPRYLPLARLVPSLEKGEVDGILTQPSDRPTVGHASDVVVEYHNVAISLASAELPIDRPRDLASYRLLAFQRARDYLGDEFLAAAARADYAETAEQIRQNLMLYAGRIDVVIADYAIFTYLDRTVPATMRKPVTVHAIFPKTPNRVVFREQALRDAFNGGLGELRRNGDYQRVMQRYLDPGINPPPSRSLPRSRRQVPPARRRNRRAGRSRLRAA